MAAELTARPAAEKEKMLPRTPPHPSCTRGRQRAALLCDFMCSRCDADNDGNTTDDVLESTMLTAPVLVLGVRVNNVDGAADGAADGVRVEDGEEEPEEPQTALREQ